MSIFRLNYNILNRNTIFRFENNSLKFKYQFLDQIIFLNLILKIQN
jgi:hypothetical protein